MRLVSVLSLVLLSAVSSLSGQAALPMVLVGRVDGDDYVSATGAYRVKMPVVAALGGSITDTENVVTFQDQISTHQSIACFEMDSTQRFEEETRGRREYLIWFFANFVQADFEQRFPGSRIESAQFLGDVQSGALLTYNLLPNGSMFGRRTMTIARNEAPVAKRGNLVFLNNGHIYVLSIELAEKVIEGRAYEKTAAEEDRLLRERLLNLLSRMTFTAAATAANSPAASK
ncbi:MAG: hypothetical protein QM790_05515 [Nibricoccus sp.]